MSAFTRTPRGHDFTASPLVFWSFVFCQPAQFVTPAPPFRRASVGGPGIDSTSRGQLAGVGNVGGPIVSRSDDWPLATPGDKRPYFDYLLIVFSGDDQDALAKRENMREVRASFTRQGG